MRAEGARRYPDAVTFAFWCRKASLLKRKEDARLEANRIGRGLVFHVAPSNIPVNFAFTFAFGLLAGNANIVRLPSRNFPQTDLIVETLRDVLRSHAEIANRTAFVRYDRDLAVTERFSMMADARMIWGGDETVKQMRSVACKPRCVDLFFSDRYSIALMDARAVADASDEELRRLAEQFYNDTWLVDQNACSSPQIVFWLHEDEAAKTRFWAAAGEVAKQKYVLQDAVAVDKYLQSCMDAARFGEEIDEIIRDSNVLTRVRLNRLSAPVTEYRGVCGYFFEYDLNDVDELAPLLTEKIQTITCFGVDQDALRKRLTDAGCRGVDRVVSTGKALDMDVVWDGYDIVRMLSRLVQSDE